MPRPGPYIMTQIADTSQDGYEANRMNNPLLQLLVLAGIAIFLILRLRNVLGTRGGYEPPQVDAPDAPRPRFDVIEGTPDEADHDILDHAEAGSQTARALAAMKTAEPSFGVMDFLNGAKSAYEMILMAFERGDLSDVRMFLAEPVAQAFQSVIDARAANASHDPLRTLRVLDRYDQEFAGGMFAMEAAVLRIEATAAKGDRATAAQLARRFLDNHPKSPHARRVKKFVVDP